MPRTKIRVTALASEAARSVDDVLAALRVAGILVHSADDYIPKSKSALARSTLRLDRRHKDQRSIASLARRAQFPESQVRQLLLDAGLLTKARLLRVSPKQLRDAEVLLGLRTPPAQPTLQRKLAATSAHSKELTSQSTSDTKARLPIQTHDVHKAPDAVIVGKIQDIRHLSPADITQIHFALVRDFRSSKDPIDPPGVRSTSLLESAAGRPRTSLGKIYKYPTVHMASAALTHAVVHNHPFHNGNKRTALVSLLVFLDKNGFLLTTTQDELYDLLLQIASHRLRYDDEDCHLEGADAETVYIATWLYFRTREIEIRERRRQWRHLRKILQHYDCDLDVAQGNRINIARGQLKTQVAFRNWGTDVEIEVIRKVRTDLELDEKNGYDSDIFYNRDVKIPKFINDYRKLLSRLAKV